MQAAKYYSYINRMDTIIITVSVVFPPHWPIQHEQNLKESFFFLKISLMRSININI